jgi:hypothetical protein
MIGALQMRGHRLAEDGLVFDQQNAHATFDCCSINLTGT